MSLSNSWKAPIGEDKKLKTKKNWMNVVKDHAKWNFITLCAIFNRINSSEFICTSTCESVKEA